LKIWHVYIGYCDWVECFRGNRYAEASVGIHSVDMYQTAKQCSKKKKKKKKNFFFSLKGKIADF